MVARGNPYILCMMDFGTFPKTLKTGLRPGTQNAHFLRILVCDAAVAWQRKVRCLILLYSKKPQIETTFFKTSCLVSYDKGIILKQAYRFIIT